MIVLRSVLLVLCYLFTFACLRIGAEGADAYSFRRTFGRVYSLDIPFFLLKRTLQTSPVSKGDGAPLYHQFQGEKIRFIPGKIWDTPLQTRKPQKETPPFLRALNRYKLIYQEIRKTPRTGLVVELESAYGLYDTFVGRFQHGTQFKGGHYYMQGHWEKTAGEEQNRREENIVTRFKADADISKRSKILLTGSYFESSVDLPQLTHVPQHNKTNIQAHAGLQMNFKNYTYAEIQLSGKRSHFNDEQSVSFDMNRYGGHALVKRFWSPKNTLSLESSGWWDRFLQDDEHLETRYYGSGKLVNSYVLRNMIAVETGVQYDYYYSDDLEYTDYFIAPIFTTRLRLLRNTTFYTTYQPSLRFPDFTDLYIRKLYTTVNPEMYSEKFRHDVESGIQQRFGDVLALNVGIFYQAREDMILRIDENNDNLLEYVQSGSARFMGIKTNLQMNLAEQFVQNITYTYTDYEVLSWQENSLIADDPALSGILPYQPNHQVQASVHWLTPLGFAFDLNGIYVSEQFRNRQTQQNHIGKRFFLNVEFIQKLSDRFQVFLLGRNLTNADTYDIIPILDSEEITSSRLFIGGVRFRF